MFGDESTRSPVPKVHLEAAFALPASGSVTFALPVGGEDERGEHERRKWRQCQSVAAMHLRM